LLKSSCKQKENKNNDQTRSPPIMFDRFFHIVFQNQNYFFANRTVRLILPKRHL